MIAGLLAGVAQFFLPTHLLAVVALGLLIGQGARAVSLVLFALGLTAGALAIASALREPPAATALLAIATLAGCLLALARRPPVPLDAALALATGAAVMLNAPPRALTIPAAIATQVGTAAAALVTLALIVWLAGRAQRPWQRTGLRVIGSWIAASAILVLALRLAR